MNTKKKINKRIVNFLNTTGVLPENCYLYDIVFKWDKFNTVLFRGNLSNVLFSNCDIVECKFYSNVLYNVTFEEGVIRSSFLSVELTKIIFFDCRIYSAFYNCRTKEHFSFKDCYIQAKFKDCILDVIRFDTQCKLHLTEFPGTEFKDFTFDNPDMRSANLSDTKGIPSQTEELKRLGFKHTDKGLIVWKIFGYFHDPPEDWIIEEGSIIEETVNIDRTLKCSHGINVATRSWFGFSFQNYQLWKCLIKWEWLADVCVPFHSEGKIRTGRLKLINRYDWAAPRGV